MSAPLFLWMSKILGEGWVPEILGQRKEGLGAWIPGSEGGDWRPTNGMGGWGQWHASAEGLGFENETWVLILAPSLVVTWVQMSLFEPLSTCVK